MEDAPAAKRRKVAEQQVPGPGVTASPANAEQQPSAAVPATHEQQQQLMWDCTSCQQHRCKCLQSGCSRTVPYQHWAAAGFWVQKPSGQPGPPVLTRPGWQSGQSDASLIVRPAAKPPAVLDTIRPGRRQPWRPSPGWEDLAVAAAATSGKGPGFVVMPRSGSSTSSSSGRSGHAVAAQRALTGPSVAATGGQSDSSSSPNSSPGRFRRRTALNEGRTSHRSVDAVHARSAPSRLRVRRSGIAQLGVFTVEPIRKGEAVCEYRGEVVRQAVADKRDLEYQAAGLGTYLFALCHDQVLDATHKGNIARFINHSCR